MGRNWNPKKSVQIALRLPEEEKKAAEAFAREQGYHSLPDWVRTLMRADMAKDTRKVGKPGR